jgi:hypothetical protein
MVELMRTNDLVLISLVEAILTSEGVRYFVADRHMSTLEGSSGFLPRRVLVDATQKGRARRALEDAGLAGELEPDKADGPDA